MADDLEEGLGAGPEDYRQAEWLAQRLRTEWKFDHTAKRWHHFDGTRWAPDKTEKVHFAIRKAVTEALSKDRVAESEQKRLFALLQWPAQERALKALATFPGYGTDGDEWDTDPYLLGVTNKGQVLDLRQNALVPAHPGQNVTRTTRRHFEPISGPDEAWHRAPEFMKVLTEWMDGDEDMVWFLLFWFGASLFGMAPEEKFLLMTGRGRNGKGTLKTAILAAGGEYAKELDPAMYMRTKYGGSNSASARADLIDLKGLRITFFSEPAGGAFNEELLKAHTGNDNITARALYSNNVQTWEATHSINFLTNDLPSVEDVGPSMGERVMVADFNRSYEGSAADEGLKDRMKAAGGDILAVLAWAASIWYARYSSGQGGIVLPERVKAASRDFMERNDPVANWLNDRTSRERDGRANSQVAYDNYLNWHASSGAPGEPMSTVRWSATLQKKGYTREKTRVANVWHGFRLFNAMEEAHRNLDEDENP